MQKYDEKALYKAANKILGKYIKEIQSKIDKYMASQPKDAKDVIFKNYTANGQDWYEGYSLYNSNKIGLYVYFYNAYDDDSNCYQIVNKIISIIKTSKLPIPFTVKRAGDEQIPIEICVDIDNLAKLDPTIKRKTEISLSDASDIIGDIVNNNDSKIKSIINRIIKKYKIENICEIFELDVHAYSYNSDYHIEIHFAYYDPYNGNNNMDPDSKEFEQLMSRVCIDIESSMKIYIPFKFKVYADDNGLYAYIKYEDIKNHKDALKYLNENSNNITIFDSVRFI